MLESLIIVSICSSCLLVPDIDAVELQLSSVVSPVSPVSPLALLSLLSLLSAFGHTKLLRM